MAPKTKAKAGNVTIAPDAKPVRLKKDGTPWPPASPKRSNAELRDEYIMKLVRFRADADKTIAKYEKRIAYFGQASTSGEDAVKELLAGGMSIEAINALEAKLRKAKKALAGKTPEQLAALRADAVPAFLAAPDEEDEESDDEE